ncbi:MAG: hypothetical protein V6Z89_12745 [Desulfobacter sp.]
MNQLTNFNIKKRRKIGILELVTPKPCTSLYDKTITANFSSPMPEIIAVWVEELGYEVNFLSYTGRESIEKEVTFDVDVLFVCAATQAAYLAYAISNMYRRKNIITILGGPHARAYAGDACRYFDYVLGLTDKHLIDDVLRAAAPNRSSGVFLTAASHPSEIPAMAKRWKFHRQTMQRRKFVHWVPLIGSFGCPNRCAFCIDAGVAYQPLPLENIARDLKFLQHRLKRPVIFWSDPNFAYRFDKYMGVVESVVKSDRIAFFAGLSLELLSRENLERMQKNHFKGIMPGVESWFAFDNKTGAKRLSGPEKVAAVSNHLNRILRYIPYIQVNLIFGLDGDRGDAPFDLTRKFIEETPGVYPAFALLTAFGNQTRMNLQYQAEQRVIDIPFPFLDTRTLYNTRLRHYTHIQFYDHLIDLMSFAFSKRMIWRRFRAGRHPMPRWAHVLRAMYIEQKLIGLFKTFRHCLANDPEFIGFYNGDTCKPPRFFENAIKKDLGAFWEYLPGRIKHYLRNGEPVNNPRLRTPDTGNNTAPFHKQ